MRIPIVVVVLVVSLVGCLVPVYGCATTSPEREACYADAHIALGRAAREQCPPPVPGEGWTTCEHRQRLLDEHTAAQARCP